MKKFLFFLISVGDVDSDSSGFSSSYAEQLGSGDFLATSQRRIKNHGEIFSVTLTLF